MSERFGYPELAVSRPAQRKTLPAEIAAQLIDLIAASNEAELVLTAERQLGEQLEVSRNVLREALATLQSMHIVRFDGKKRIADVARARAQRVARLPEGSPERELAADPVEVRMMIEPDAAALAAERATPAALDELESHLDLLRRAIDRGELGVQYDVAFHVAIARSTRNQVLVALVQSLAEMVEPSREHASHAPSAADASVADHADILDAIRTQDPERARAAMRSHLNRVERFVREALSKELTDRSPDQI